MDWPTAIVFCVFFAAVFGWVPIQINRGGCRCGIDDDGD